MVRCNHCNKAFVAMAPDVMVVCPNCKAKCSVSPHCLGKLVNCGSCHKPFLAFAPGGAAVPGAGKEAQKPVDLSAVLSEARVQLAKSQASKRISASTEKPPYSILRDFLLPFLVHPFGALVFAFGTAMAMNHPRGDDASLLYFHVGLSKEFWGVYLFCLFSAATISYSAVARCRACVENGNNKQATAVATRFRRGTWIALLIGLVFSVPAICLYWPRPLPQPKLVEAFSEGRSGTGRFIPLADKDGGEEQTISLPNGVDLVMVRIPGGPWFGKYEVTQAQWEAVMGERPPLESKHDEILKGPDNPVVNVSWNDCQAFLEKLGALRSVKRSGLTFRLPTYEAWDYACRAGSTSLFFGKLADGTEITTWSELGQAAWWFYNSEHRIHPVGSKKPNAFGLYDMIGNAAEWTQAADGRGLDLVGGCWRDDLHTIDWTEGEGSFGIWSRTARSRGTGFRLCAFGKKQKRLIPPPLAERPIEAAAQKTAEAKVKERAEELGSSPVVKAAAESILASMVDIPGRKNKYKMGRTEVTQSQWTAIMGENPSAVQGDDNPVQGVSWADCLAFITLLNSISEVGRSGLVFRFPTEEEWKFAARAGAKGEYCRLPGGREITEKTLGEVAWFDENSDHKTHPVGQKKPNAFGLYDMYGNVAEWTSTISSDENRIVLGGDFSDEILAGSSFPSFGHDPFLGLSCHGFRLCAEAKNDKRR